MAQVDVLVAEQTQAAGLTGLIVMPPTLREYTTTQCITLLTTIDGRGSGTWNRLSPQIPALVKAAIKNKQVYQFPKDKVSPRRYLQVHNHVST